MAVAPAYPRRRLPEAWIPRRDVVGLISQDWVYSAEVDPLGAIPARPFSASSYGEYSGVAHDSLLTSLLITDDAAELTNIDARHFAGRGRVVGLRRGGTNGIFAFAEDNLRETIRDIGEMKSWDMDEDGAPLVDRTIERAATWLAGLSLELGLNGQAWVKPNVTLSPWGEVVLSWRNGAKRLVIRISADQARYLKAWGPDIDDEMVDGSADTSGIRAQLLAWLTR